VQFAYFQRRKERFAHTRLLKIVIFKIFSRPYARYSSKNADLPPASGRKIGIIDKTVLKRDVVSSDTLNTRFVRLVRSARFASALKSAFSLSPVPSQGGEAARRSVKTSKPAKSNDRFRFSIEFV
jgi:hypothetical protein